jgi:hypothetical protein
LRKRMVRNNTENASSRQALHRPRIYIMYILYLYNIYDIYITFSCALLTPTRNYF